VVVCLERSADLHMAQLMPLPLTVSCFSKIQIGLTFLVPAHPGSPGQRAVKRLCVCVCVCAGRCCRSTDGRTDIITGSRPFRGPCSAQYAGSVSKNKISCSIRRTRAMRCLSRILLYAQKWMLSTINGRGRRPNVGSRNSRGRRRDFASRTWLYIVGLCTKSAQCVELL